MMQMRRKFSAIFIGVFLALFFSPCVAYAADENGDRYDDGDVAIVQNILSGSSTVSGNCIPDNPADWTEKGYVYWGGDPMRVIRLDLSSAGDYTGELDVSGLSELVTLDCSGNQGLTSLKLPNTSTLTWLNCIDTGITELDVSANTRLECLYCSNTGITVLDVSKNVALIDLFCDGTGITGLDVSANTQLERLGCSNTGITVLDVSKNVALLDLFCDGTGITVLDVSKNTALVGLFCNNTQIAVLDLSNNQNLQMIDLPILSRLETGNGAVIVNQTTGGTVTINQYSDTGITLWASAEPGYQLTGWSGLPENAVQNGEQVEFSVTGDLTVSAEFSVVGDGEQNPIQPSVPANGENTDNSDKNNSATVVTSPKTGEDTSIWNETPLMILLIVALAVCIFAYHKKNNGNI